MDATLVPLFKLKLDMAVASYTKKENPVGEVEVFFDGLRQYLNLSGAAGCVKMENIVVGWPIHHKTCRNTFFAYFSWIDIFAQLSVLYIIVQ